MQSGLILTSSEALRAALLRSCPTPTCHGLMSPHLAPALQASHTWAAVASWPSLAVLPREALGTCSISDSLMAGFTANLRQTEHTT